MSRVIAFLHPLTALASLLFLAYVASLGLRSRDRVERHLRPKHARLATWAYAMMIANVGAGALSRWALRPDITDQGIMHFRLGLAIVLLMSVVALLSRWIGSNETARVLHP